MASLAIVVIENNKMNKKEIEWEHGTEAIAMKEMENYYYYYRLKSRETDVLLFFFLIINYFNAFSFGVFSLFREIVNIAKLRTH